MDMNQDDKMKGQKGPKLGNSGSSSIRKALARLVSAEAQTINLHSLQSIVPGELKEHQETIYSTSPINTIGGVNNVNWPELE